MSNDNVRRDAEEKLHRALDAVHDEATFCSFLLALAQDWCQEQEMEKEHPSQGRYGPGQLGWENGTIGDFLGAASVGLYGRNAETNVWNRAAHIIWLGKIYE